MDASSQLSSKVAAWLSSSGYPLEMYAHQKLAQNGFHCEKSPLYTDVETNVEREIDVFAEGGFGKPSDHHSFVINLLVECKKSKHPLVVLSTAGEISNSRKEIFDAHVWPEKLKNASILAAAGHELDVYSDDDALPLSTVVRSGYSMVQALKDSDEVVHKALFGLAKAEHYFEAQFEDLFEASLKNKESVHLLIGLFVSVLLVDAPLFNAYLQNGEVKVEQTNRASVTMNLPWISRPQSERRANIQVVTRDSFGEFLDEVAAFGNWFGEANSIRNAAKLVG